MVTIYTARHPVADWQWQRHTPLAKQWFGVVTDAAKLRKVLADRQGPGAPPIPDVDWERQVLVVAAPGEVPTGGWAVRITCITEQADHVLVRVHLRSPQPTDLVPQVICYPVDFVCLPKAKLPPPAKAWVFEDQYGCRLATFRWPTPPSDAKA